MKSKKLVQRIERIEEHEAEPIEIIHNWPNEIERRITVIEKPSKELQKLAGKSLKVTFGN